jgi:mannose-6-phosphate isomerase-like protein (cupin superfamily)
MKYVFNKKEAFRADLKNPIRTSYIFVDREKGARNCSGGTSDIPPRSALPYHAHEKEEEVMFIYKGKGEVIIEGEIFPLESETMIFIPPGIKHQIRNIGDEALSFVYFCAPGGPEQFLRAAVKEY